MSRALLLALLALLALGACERASPVPALNPAPAASIEAPNPWGIGPPGAGPRR